MPNRQGPGPRARAMAGARAPLGLTRALTLVAALAPLTGAAALLSGLPAPVLAQEAEATETAEAGEADALDLTTARRNWENGRYAGVFETLRAEAEAGVPEAQVMLGISLAAPEGDRGLEPDPEAALAWFDKAIAQDHLPATVEKARFLAQERPDRPADYEAARDLAEAAAERGSARALTLLGDMALHGLGQEPHPEAAVGFYRRAADQGEPAALRAMAEAHFRGHGVTGDLGLARAYLERAVAAGDRRAIPDLAWLYEGNDGVERDLVKAYLLYRLGVERGLARAAYDLGFFVAWDEYPGFWHNPLEGYGYCLLGVDWGHELAEGDAAAECETLAEPLDEDERSAARAFADGLK